MKPIYAAAISRSAPKLVAPLRLTNDGDEAATVEFFDNYAAGTKLKIRTTADGEWQQWDFSTITLQPGEFVEICGENSECTNMLGKFELTGSIAASGSVMSMVYGEKTNEQNQKLLTFNAFGYYNEDSGDEDGMFYGCTGLTAAPELPATTLATSCYASMFNGCTGLTAAPELPATTLATNCYISMFNGCTGLTAAPELPATTLATSCYASMFNGCTGLTAAPELPATTLAANCYASMFNGCTGLTEVAVGFSAWDNDNNATSNWLGGVAASGTFKCPAGLDTTTRDASHVPENWTVENV